MAKDVSCQMSNGWCNLCQTNKNNETKRMRLCQFDLLFVGTEGSIKCVFVYDFDFIAFT